LRERSAVPPAPIRPHNQPPPPHTHTHNVLHGFCCSLCISAVYWCVFLFVYSLQPIYLHTPQHTKVRARSPPPHHPPSDLCLVQYHELPLDLLEHRLVRHSHLVGREAHVEGGGAPVQPTRGQQAAKGLAVSEGAPVGQHLGGTVCVCLGRGGGRRDSTRGEGGLEGGSGHTGLF